MNPGPMVPSFPARSVKKQRVKKGFKNKPIEKKEDPCLKIPKNKMERLKKKKKKIGVEKKSFLTRDPKILQQSVLISKSF